MIPHLSPIADKVRAIGDRYVLLHLKCADGSITEDEAAELDLMQAEKAQEYERDMGDCADEPRTVAGRERSQSPLSPPSGRPSTIAEITRDGERANNASPSNQ